ncbi:hypothetical protein [Subtercola lobariae]|uniref:hypothetical protein n=1 Tax=Subtercola lobariae TaxID=1588641 RepID=UPI0016660825|nr:hypothetical protein [Subtercola lobariae]
MTGMPDSGRLAASVLLDAVVSQNPENSEAENRVALDMALALLVADDDADERNPASIIDASDLVGAAVVLSSWLISRLAEARGVDIADVAVELRAFIGDA